jgi:hypothetical protein
MRTCQNEDNILLNFPRCLSTIRTDNNALDIDAIYNLKLNFTTKYNVNACLKICKIYCNDGYCNHIIITYAQNKKHLFHGPFNSINAINILFADILNSTYIFEFY